MDLIFNELSIEPLVSEKKDAFNRVENFILTFKKASEFNFNKIRFHSGFESIGLTNNYTLNDYCNEPKNKTRAILLRGLFRFPFIDENSDEEERYIQNEFKLTRDREIIAPYGLAVAYLYSTLAIGFDSDSFWEKFLFIINISQNEQSFKENVICVSKPEHFEQNQVIEYIQNSTPIELFETFTDPEKKTISLRNDHGKDILEKFAKRLCKSTYIISVINSLPFNSFDTEFIRKIYPDGRIEIVLTKTDKGLGLVVKTTGRNKQETEQIAKIIENKYRE